MAKGGSMKGHIHSHHNNGSRGRSTHAVLVLLAFGVAIFGVVIVHKLRERRMFNMLVKDKEIELIHLKLLLQVHSLHLLCRVMCHVSCVSVSLFSVSEREHAKEAKTKAEEMKSKMQWVRMQKRDLESRILEMKSTISSLKDEQRIIEVALEEKQAEINMLTEKLTETNREDSRAKLISESVQQKEAEIDIPVKIWSMSADDPSNPTNLTKAAGGETEVLRESVERDEQKNSTTENIPRNADQSALKRDEAVQGEDRGQAQDGEQESQELRTAQEDVPGDKNSTIFQTLDGKRKTIDSPKTGEIFLEEKRYDLENASMESINRSGQVQKQSKDAGVVNAADWKEHGTTIGGDQGNFEDSQGITRSLDRITRVQMNQD
ncbi:hypothetical protein T459_23913 [Capsicum annuum]|uniref:Uncharacterized protein n=1 Tax=Capsicum annuum TaxID=4072 RepID=A0A2G2YTN8_CAPAN|nr:hypothetical protein T459_23913 [Capsicum annuum]